MLVSKFHTLGLMSGTSLDGLDIAYCVFEEKNNIWNWSILQAETIPYPVSLKKRIEQVFHGTAYEYAQLHADLGKYIGEQVNLFVQKHHISKQQIDLISSHGHTIFHQPQLRFTSQIGCGATIAAITGIKTVCDFRTTDVAKGGQGAPLVPIGDQMLFSGYDAFLNLGGFANISFQRDKKYLAFDICPVNFVLNHYSAQIGQLYDDGGKVAKKGKINQNICLQLDKLDYYAQEGQKSMGREWVDLNILPVLDQIDDVEDILATFVEHISKQITGVLKKYQISSVLISGGGTFNTFLIEQIQKKTTCNLQIPDKQVVNYKEALIFAFLGLLRVEEKTNILSSVTGASTDSVGGAVYLP